MGKSLKEWCMEHERQDILARWDKENIEEPEKLSYGSEKKVSWICEFGHRWEASPNKITSKKTSGCPYCANQKVWKGFNDLSTFRPEVAQEWNFEKNKNLTPDQVTVCSNKKVWWKCKNGHEYEASINQRTRKERGEGCPYCANKKLLPGFNDLKTVCPEVAVEWHPFRNGNFRPEDVFASCGKKVWWICSKGHEYQQSLNARVKKGERKSGCPVCAGKRREKGVNDLESLYPEIAVEWDVKKNGGITPDQIGPGAHKKYCWICPVGHSYQAAPENRTKIRGTSCPICAKERQTSFPEQCIYFYFKKQYPQTENRYQLEGKELDIYIPELKAGIEYDGKRFHTNREKERKKDLFFQKKGIRVIRIKEYEGEKPQEEKDIIWIREKDNLFNNLSFAIRQVCYLLTGDLNVEIIDFEEKRTEIWNLYCFSIKENSIAARHPEFLKEWNCEKNGKLKPEQISYGSGKKVWWVCKKGHEYQMAPCARAKGAGCPICAGQRLLSGYNDLQTRYPEIAKEWDEEKNGGLQPSQVMPGTVKRVWWKCERNHSYMTTVASRTNAKSGCPYCSGRKAICGENDLFTIFPKLEREWDVEKNKDVDPRGMSPYTHRKVWWICPKGHSYLSAVSNRTKNMAKTNGNGCPYCSEQKVLSGFNDLQTRYPMIAAMWHPAKNGEIQSNMVAPYSTQKAWWIDWNGREVYRRIDSMVAMAKKRIYLE